MADCRAAAASSGRRSCSRLSLLCRLLGGQKFADCQKGLGGACLLHFEHRRGQRLLDAVRGKIFAIRHERDSKFRTTCSPSDPSTFHSGFTQEAAT